MDIGVPGTYTMINSMLKNDFQQGIEEAAQEDNNVKELYREVPINTKISVNSFLGQTGGLRTWAYGEPRVRRNVETHDFSKTNIRFEATFSIPVDDIEYDMLSSYKVMSNRMGVDAKQKVHEQLFNVFNNGFSAETTWDGLSYFNDAHTVGVSTIDNLIAGALGSTTFEEAYVKIKSFRFQPDSASPSEPLNPNGRYVLLVPPELELTARKIVDTELISTGGSNIDSRLGVKVISTGWLTSSTAWFLVNVGGMKPVFWQYFKGPVFQNLTPANGGDEFTLDEITYGVKIRGVAFPTNPWLAVGSTGAST